MELKSATKKVQAFLAKHTVSTEIKQLASSTRTAQEAADTLGCHVAQIAKSIIFRNTATNTPVLVIASGINRIDTNKIEAIAGIQLGKADADFVKAHLGFAIGGVPPVSHNQDVPVYLDVDLKRYEVLWAAAGTPHSVFRTSAEMLSDLTGGQWIDVTKT